jgi:hypothetical protein
MICSVPYFPLFMLISCLMRHLWLIHHDYEMSWEQYNTYTFNMEYKICSYTYKMSPFCMPNKSISSVTIKEFETGAAVYLLPVKLLRTYVFWDITPYSLVKVNRHFGETYCLHSQSFEERAIQEASMKQMANNMFLRKISWLSPDYKALYTRRQNTSWAVVQEPQFQHIFSLLNLPRNKFPQPPSSYCSWQTFRKWKDVAILYDVISVSSLDENKPHLMRPATKGLSSTSLGLYQRVKQPLTAAILFIALHTLLLIYNTYHIKS